MTYPIVLAHGICRFDVLLRDLLNDEEKAADAMHTKITSLTTIGTPLGLPRGETQAELETRIRGLYVGIAQKLAERFPAN
jgi:hypothetical protein